MRGHQGETHLFRYILRRVLIILPLLLAVSFIVFFIIASDPEVTVRVMLGIDATDEAVTETMKELGLDRPFLARYFDYITDVVRGDFGVSYRSKVPVADQIVKKLPITLRLSSLGLLLAVAVGVPIGVVSAIKRNSFADHFSKVLALILASIPSFWLALMMVLLFSVRLRLLPSMGFDKPVQWILPMISTASLTLATIIRMTSGTMTEVIRQDYIRTAKAKGAAPLDVIVRHILKNSWLPIITTIGIYFGILMGGTIIIEQIFSIPGIGLLILQGVVTRDTPVVMGGVLVLAVATTLINLIIDIAYTLIDPRVKAEFLKVKK